MAKHIKRRTFGTVLAAGSLLIAACGSGSSGQNVNATSATLRVAAAASGPFTQTFNPLLSSSSNTVGFANFALYEPLLEDDFAHDTNRPWLATSFSWEDGGKTLHLQVRKGVTWHDGQAMTADDVAFTFEMVRKNAAFNTYGLPLAGATSPAPDQVLVTFTQPSYQVMWWRTPVVPKHVWANVADPVKYVDTNAIGTGPYMLKTFTPQVITMVKNPHYWQPGEPNVGTVQYLSFESVESMLTSFEAGQVDWIGVSAIDPQPIANHDRAHIAYWETKPTNAVVELLPNYTVYPLNQTPVRRAISLALDRGAISKTGTGGQNLPLQSPTGLDVAARADLIDPGYKNLRYGAADPGSAKKELTAAGFKLGPDGVFLTPDGRRLELQLMLPTSNPYGDFVRASQVIVRELKDAGISIAVKTQSQVAWRDDTDLGNYQLTLRPLGGTLSTYDYFDRIFSQDQLVAPGKKALRNWSRYKSGEAPPLLKQYAVSAPGSAGEKQALAGLQKLMVEEVPVIPLFFTSGIGFFRTNTVRGFPSQNDPYAVPVPDSVNAAIVLGRVRAGGK
jgi:peptide/nickel transport system substrate-binding protein